MNPTVFLVDDDEAIRDALGWLLQSRDLSCRSFPSAEAFLAQWNAELAGCLLLDIRMPGMTGLELQEELSRRRCRIPIVFLTGHGDIPMAVRALKKGAFDFIEKPHDPQRLLLAILGALRFADERRSGQRAQPPASPDLAGRLALLSTREREVLDLILEGWQTRAIAERLCVSVKTVEFHRGRIREKLQVGSLAELFGLFLPHARGGGERDAP